MENKLLPHNCDFLVKQLIQQYHVYGAECIINALARASLSEPYLDGLVLSSMIRYAYEREDRRSHETN